ncbi:unnamed protein product, partial [Porites evermanni]
MKIRSQILKYMHLDRTYCLLTGRCSSSEVKLIFVVFTLRERVADCFLYIYLPSPHGYDVQFSYDRRTYWPTNFSFRVLLNIGLVPKELSTRELKSPTSVSVVGRNVRIILELFRLIDVHDEMALNDVQFCAFMKTATDLSTNQIYKVFDMLDVDGSGSMDFDEFYLLICILIAVQDKVEKNFIYRHSRTVFDLLDEDSSGNISAYEFETFGFLFNLQGEAIRTIFSEFDVSGDQV